MKIGDLRVFSEIYEVEVCHARLGSQNLWEV